MFIRTYSYSPVHITLTPQTSSSYFKLTTCTYLWQYKWYDQGILTDWQGTGKSTPGYTKYVRFIHFPIDVTKRFIFGSFTNAYQPFFTVQTKYVYAGTFLLKGCFFYYN